MFFGQLSDPHEERLIETNTHNTSAVIRPAGEENYTYVLMPMHVDGK